MIRRGKGGLWTIGKRTLGNMGHRKRQGEKEDAMPKDRQAGLERTNGR